MLQQFSLAPDGETCGIRCFFIAPDYVRIGLASQLLNSITYKLGGKGVERVLAFPKKTVDLCDADLWNGPYSMFVEAGFSILREDRSNAVLINDVTV